MKTSWVRKFRGGLLAAGLLVAATGLIGCADEYAAYPGYHGGYYASYGSTPYPYYGGYGYPYRAYGPYYGGPYYGYGTSYYNYGSPYYYRSGSPYYRSSAVVVPNTYSRTSRTYTYRDQYGRLHTTRKVNRARTTRQTTRTQTTRLPAYDSDDEQHYYRRP